MWWWCSTADMPRHLARALPPCNACYWDTHGTAIRAIVGSNLLVHLAINPVSDCNALLLQISLLKKTPAGNFDSAGEIQGTVEFVNGQVGRAGAWTEQVHG